MIRLIDLIEKIDLMVRKIDMIGELIDQIGRMVQSKIQSSPLLWNLEFSHSGAHPSPSLHL